ncbi:MAG: phosphoglycerate kinase [Bacteroidetes bacterium]|nr:MAG: phosphoglycerate kinase [Bacteroidota bacterium]
MIQFKDYPFKGKRVLLRVDFNVPFDKTDTLITDDSRIRRAIPTIQHIVNAGGRVVLLSHRGRPKGKVVESLSLQRVLRTLEALVGKHVEFAPDCIGEEALAKTKSLKDGDILLMENVRFHAEDEGKVKQKEGEAEADFAERKKAMKAAQKAFAQQLALNGDCYVNDAFSAAHRAHASTTFVAESFPQDRMFGPLMLAELDALERMLNQPTKPILAIMGGAKVSDKILLIDRLLDRVDRIIIGGGMTYTFVKAMGGQIGNSLCEDDRLDVAKELIAKAKQKGVELLLPTDAVNADKFAADAKTNTTSVDATPDGYMGLDIGPESVKRFSEAILQSKSILWNGPMGVFEMEPFAKGTFAIAEALAQATKNGAYTLVGGGDSVSALKSSGNEEHVSYVSTGGGAMLEYLEGKVLPGIGVIQDHK